MRCPVCQIEFSASAAPLDVVSEDATGKLSVDLRICRYCHHVLVDPRKNGKFVPASGQFAREAHAALTESTEVDSYRACCGHLIAVHLPECPDCGELHTGGKHIEEDDEFENDLALDEIEDEIARALEESERTGAPVVFGGGTGAFARLSEDKQQRIMEILKEDCPECQPEEESGADGSRN